ncbi:MAG: tetratricopeptide repeat protein [Clostridia bacterium]|nr:tetratricopeptide repeat protein [Clostridia bacterium]
MEVYDYWDPQCPFNTEWFMKEPPVRAVPVRDVLSKFDEHLAKDDSESAKKLLLYWLEEAKNGRDKKAELIILNELMGLCRNRGERDEAVKYAEEGMAFAKENGFWETTEGATAALNAATVYKAFDMPHRAIELYGYARGIYEKSLDKNDYRVGSLYNNMGLAYFALGEYEKAEELYNMAISVMEALGDRRAEHAITHLNIADVINARDGIKGEKEIGVCLDRAQALLDAVKIRDGKYAFMCDKCASVFGFYGRFLYEKELRKRVREIYERS